MGGGELHQAVRSLCFNNDWVYAVFWKLKHRARMVLTWEDAYYDHHGQNESSGSKFFGDMGSSRDGHSSHDILGLAVAKMSYHVYSLGEGVVGEVAATGKHVWISRDNHGSDSCSSLQKYDGWQTQFSAGIRTIAVVAVPPHGVVQLGSLCTATCYPLHPEVCSFLKKYCPDEYPFCNKIAEDLKLVDHIKDMFYGIQGSFMGNISSALPCNIESSSFLSDVFTGGLVAENFRDCTDNFDKNAVKSMKKNWSPMLPSTAKNCDSSCTMISDHLGPDYSVSGVADANLLQSNSQNFRMEQHEQVHEEVFIEKLFELQNEINNLDMLKSSFEFPAGCELYEALGPAFNKQKIHHVSETRNTEAESSLEMPAKGKCSSNPSTTNSGSENLLEAVVASVCHSGSECRGAKFSSISAQSLLTTEKSVVPPSSDICNSGSACYSFDRSTLIEEDSLYSLTSQGFSSTSQSRCSEQLERPQEQTKANKKRARPGENSRPRPRDRQLIQDRIKELRELVPNGSKCSIDCLLERTIKHMLFMQCVTKHADKIDKCAESKLLNKESVSRRSSSHEQGSSWAMEVGGDLKVCPIIVENINTNGQMLVEMLCEKCIHFLEIAEAIRSLGLIILKGVTEAYGEKTWICFVVEGENNRSPHRMDVLWSLVQILQFKTTT